MDDLRVYIVLLRRPRSARQNPAESRSDPYYEFGSFGCTGCHDRNLMKPDAKIELLNGARLAFAQGGDRGFRLVLLTSPVAIQRWKDRCEARWTPPDMPFRYDAAPVLVSNDGRSDFPLLQQLAMRTQRGRERPEGGLASLFRGRRRPLNADLAAEVVEVYERLRAQAPASAVAGVYSDSLPYPPPAPDRDRTSSYRTRIAALGGPTCSTCRAPRRAAQNGLPAGRGSRRRQ